MLTTIPTPSLLMVHILRQRLLYKHSRDMLPGKSDPCDFDDCQVVLEDDRVSEIQTL
jgi:hypothetical protein